jgi:hypothetical protein
VEMLRIAEIHVMSSSLFVTHTRILLTYMSRFLDTVALSLFHCCATKKDDKTWRDDSREICYTVRHS